MHDEQGKVIDDIINYTGNFKTGKRIIVNNEYDKFLSMKSGKELMSIEGTEDGKETSHGSHTSIIKFTVVKGVLRESKDIVYHFNKNGSEKK